MGPSLVNALAERRRFFAAMTLALASVAITYGSFTDHGDARLFLTVIAATTVVALLFGLVSLRS